MSEQYYSQSNPTSASRLRRRLAGWVCGAWGCCAQRVGWDCAVLYVTCRVPTHLLPPAGVTAGTLLLPAAVASSVVFAWATIHQWPSALPWEPLWLGFHKPSWSPGEPREPGKWGITLLFGHGQQSLGEELL